MKITIQGVLPCCNVAAEKAFASATGLSLKIAGAVLAEIDKRKIFFPLDIEERFIKDLKSTCVCTVHNRSKELLRKAVAALLEEEEYEAASEVAAILGHYARKS